MSISFIVKFATGKGVSVTLPETATIADVKAKLFADDAGEEKESKEGSKVKPDFDACKLYQGEKPLDDATTLKGMNLAEEAILHFKWTGGIKCTATSEYSVVSCAAQERFTIMVSLKAPRIMDVQRVPIDLCLVVDRSGSMSSLMALVVDTIKFMISQLQETDRLSIVDYDDRVSICLGLTSMDQAGKERAVAAAEQLSPRGGTNLADGMFQGMSLIQNRGQGANEVASVLVFTDGQANVGLTKLDQIVPQMHNPRFLADFHVEDKGPQRTQVQQLTATATPKPSFLSGMSNLLSGSKTNKFAAQRVPQKKSSSPLQQQAVGPQPQGISSGQQTVGPQVQQPQPQQQQQQQQQQPPSDLSQQAVGPGQISNSSSSSSSQSSPTISSSAQNQAVGPEVQQQTSEVVGPDETSAELQATRGAPVTYTVNTFGFGANHNAELLKGIAEGGNGLYFYIKDKDSVGPAFVDCVGGLLSVVGQKLVLDVEGLSGAEVVEVLTSFPTTRTNNRVSVAIRDIQSEESRDLLCIVKLPAAEPVSDQPVLACKLEYDNCITGNHDVVCLERKISRLSVGDPELKNAVASLQVDEQLNRVRVANALHESSVLANQNKLQEARELLTKASDELLASPTANYESAQGLSKGLTTALSGLQNEHVYQSVGSKMNSNLSQAYHQQRSSPATEGMSSYKNVKKSKMLSSYSNR